MYPEYERVIICVITENQQQQQLYFNLFRLMLGDQIEELRDAVDRKVIKTNKVELKFIPKTLSSRGNKAHYLLNLTQDKEYHEQVALPMTVIHDYLKRDFKWESLFNDIK